MLVFTLEVDDIIVVIDIRATTIHTNATIQSMDSNRSDRLLGFVGIRKTIVRTHLNIHDGNIDVIDIPINLSRMVFGNERILKSIVAIDFEVFHSVILLVEILTFTHSRKLHRFETFTEQSFPLSFLFGRKEYGWRVFYSCVKSLTVVYSTKKY